MTDGLTSDEPGLPRPWERMPQETRQAYYCFTIYRDSPPLERSAARVASECGRNVSLIERWRSTWSWVDRARAWDAMQDAARRRSQIEASIRMGERQARDAADIQAAMIAPIRELVERLGDRLRADELKRLSIGDLILLSVQTGRIWPAAARAERLARGAPTPDYGAFEEEEEGEVASIADDDAHLAEVWLAMDEAGLRPRLALPPGPPVDPEGNGSGNGHA